MPPTTNKVIDVLKSFVLSSVISRVSMPILSVHCKGHEEPSGHCPVEHTVVFAVCSSRAYLDHHYSNSLNELGCPKRPCVAFVRRATDDHSVFIKDTWILQSAPPRPNTMLDFWSGVQERGSGRLAVTWGLMVTFKSGCASWRFPLGREEFNRG